MYSEKVSKNELHKIFKNYANRSTFIHTYSHFGNDNNDDYYKDFITDNIFGKKYKLQEDAIELSLATKAFNTTYLNVISKTIYSRRISWIKLLCLDWLNYFINDIPTQLFTELNLFTKRSDNDLLKLQSILNLILINKDTKLIEESLCILKQSTNNTLYYRFVNCFTDNNLVNLLPAKVSQEINNLITSSKTLTESQKTELIGKLLTALVSAYNIK